MTAKVEIPVGEQANSDTRGECGKCGASYEPFCITVDTTRKSKSYKPLSELGIVRRDYGYVCRDCLADHRGLSPLSESH